MYDVGDSLHDAFVDARNRLLECQARIARTNAGEASGRGADAAMASTARAAIFTEALLAAERARFAEIKAVAK